MECDPKSNFICSPTVPLNLLRCSCPSPATSWKFIRLHGITGHSWVIKSSLSLHRHNNNPKPPVPANYKNFKQELILNFFHPCWSRWLILNCLSLWDFYSLPEGCWHIWTGIQSREKKDKKDDCLLLGPDNCLKLNLSEHVSVFSRGVSAGTL